jgi:hypothetical protein
MMEILKAKKSVSKKAGPKSQKRSADNYFRPGSVSRLAGSAHRWVELYAARVQRKTMQSQIDYSGIENNPRPLQYQSALAGPTSLRNA